MKKLYVLMIMITGFSCAAVKDFPLTFNWIEKNKKGEFELGVRYPNSAEDVITLRSYNPMSYQPTYINSIGNACTFRGSLKNEPLNQVTVSGGCFNQTSFDIHIPSSNLNGNLFRVENGSALQSRPYLGAANTIDFIDTNSQFPTNVTNSTSSAVLPSDGLIYKIAIIYDNSWLKKHQNHIECKKAILRTVALVQAIFRWPSAPVKMFLNLTSISYKNINLTPDKNGLQMMRQLATDSNVDTFVGIAANSVNFTNAGASSIAVGAAKFKTVCGPTHKRVAVVGFTDAPVVSLAEVFAQLIGHSLGIPHDFNDADRSNITDSASKTCSNVGGIMDYNEIKQIWTNCSREKFFKHFREVIAAKGTFCLAQIPKVSFEGGDPNIKQGIVNGFNPVTKITGVICAANYRIETANVICKQLGFLGAISFNYINESVASSFPYAYQNVSCRGDEDFLDACPHKNPVNNTCESHAALGVQCYGLKDSIWGDWSDFGSCSVSCGSGLKTRTRECEIVGPSTDDPNCVGDSSENVPCVLDSCPEVIILIDLRGGNGSNEGIVFALNNATKIFGPVCNDEFFDISEANIACRQLGYPQALEFGESSRFGEAFGDYSFSNLNCQGSEKSFNGCESKDGSDCPPSMAVGLVCDKPSVALVGGKESYEGLLYATNPLTGNFGPICDRFFGKIEADVICKQLEFPGSVSTTCCSNETIGNFMSLKCKGNETSIAECSFTTDYECLAANGVRVVCSTPKISLIGNYGFHKGEVFATNMATKKYGPVCYDDFDFNEAKVVCKQMSMGRPLSFSKGSKFGGKYFSFSKLKCKGNESEIDNCSHSTKINDCPSGQVVSVECRKAVVTLKDTPVEHEGTVYARNPVTGFFGPVCDDYFSNNTANVVCKELGFLNAISYNINSYYAKVPDYFSYDNVLCNGTENSIEDCQHQNWDDCGPTEGVGVLCQPVKQTPVDGGWSEWEVMGRDCNRMCNGGTQSRRRMCKNPTPVNDGLYCQGSDYDQIACNVMPCPKVILLGGAHYGALYANNPVTNVFGPVCDDGFDIDDANVVCTQLGFAEAIGVYNQATNFVPWNYFLEYSNFSYSEMECRGNETSMDSCPHLNTADCHFSEIAAIYCLPPGPYYSIDGAWTEWGPYESCNQTCGKGTQTRTRTCTNPPPINGERCYGIHTESDLCNVQKCLNSTETVPLVGLIVGKHSVELFAPDGNSSQLLTTLNVRPRNVVMGVFEGRVLVCLLNHANKCLRYNFYYDEWTHFTSPKYKHINATAAVYKQNLFILDSRHAEYFNSSKNSWNFWPSIPTKVFEPCMVQRKDSFIVFSNDSSAVHTFNITSWTWSKNPAQGSATLISPSCVLLPTDGVLVYNGKFLGKTMYRYNIQTNTWASTAQTKWRYSEPGFLNFGSRVIVMGGEDNSCEEYNYGNDTWSSLSRCFIVNSVSLEATGIAIPSSIIGDEKLLESLK